MIKFSIRLAFTLLTAVCLMHSVGCAATDESPRTVGQWMQLDQVKP